MSGFTKTFLSDSERHSIVTSYNFGVSKRVLMKRYHLSDMRLTDILKDAGCVLRTKSAKKDALDVKKIIAYYKEGHSIEQTTRFHNISTRSLKKLLLEHNLFVPKKASSHVIQDSVKRAIIARFKDSEAVRDIANRYKISPTTVRNILHREGVKSITPYRKLTQEDLEEILKKYSQNMSIKDISEYYNVHEKTISKVVHGKSLSYSLEQLTEHQQNEIKERTLKGVSAPKIAHSLNIPLYDVYRVLRSYNIKKPQMA